MYQNLRNKINRLKIQHEQQHGFKNAKERKHFRQYAEKWGMDVNSINSPDDFHNELKNIIPNYFDGHPDPEKDKRFNEVLERSMP